ncbi:MAG: hypothetical protein ACRD3I_10165 [Terriglobales bacterium]
MRRAVAMVTLAAAVGLSPALVDAQARPGAPAAPVQPTTRPGDEIKLDENTSLKASALEARLQALQAQWALLQRLVQDMQLEAQKIVEERKALIEGAAKRANVDARDMAEWVLDTKGQRYVRVQRPAPGAQAPQR